MLPPQVLIVEDERIIALDLKRRLTRLGYAVVAIAGSGAEAIAQAQAHGPDLVLIWHRLSRGDDRTGGGRTHLGGTEDSPRLCHGLCRCADLSAGEDPSASPDRAQTV